MAAKLMVTSDHAQLSPCQGAGIPQPSPLLRARRAREWGRRWCAILLLTVPGTAGAQARASTQESFPRALTLIAPAAPGGGWDQTARLMQQILRSQGLAAQVQVENAPGAAGTIGLARFIGSERGHGDALLVTGLVMVSGIVANHSPFTLADATPIARLTGEWEVIVVPASSPYRTLEDLLAAFKTSPGAVSWGGGSAGGTDDLLVRLLAETAGVDPMAVNYIAFAGGGEALAALLGSQVSAGVSGYGEMAAQIESGDLRALALSAPDSVPGIPAPTLRSLGFDVVLANWRGVLAPPGISEADRVTLDSLVARLAASDGWRRALQRNGWTDLYQAGPDFAAFLHDESERISRIVARIRSAPAGGVASSAAAPGGTIYPLLVLLASALVGTGLTIQSIMRRRSGRGDVGTVEVTRGNRVAVVVLLVGAILDIAFFERLGFIVASTVLFVLVAWAFGSRRLLRDLAAGLLFAAVVHVTFAMGLGVTLPSGPFPWP